MTSTRESCDRGSMQNGNATGVPSLPANVSIFSPANPDAARALLSARILTRLTVSAQIEPSRLAMALRSTGQPDVNAAFCLSHRNIVLIFDADTEGSDLEDVHHEHFRLVCLALKDADISLNVAGCLFDVPDVLQAGFQLDQLSDGAVLVIDLMPADDDDDSDSDGDADSNEGAAGDPVR